MCLWVLAIVLRVDSYTNTHIPYIKRLRLYWCDFMVLCMCTCVGVGVGVGVGGGGRWGGQGGAVTAATEASAAIQ